MKLNIIARHDKHVCCHLRIHNKDKSVVFSYETVKGTTDNSLEISEVIVQQNLFSFSSGIQSFLWQFCT